MVPVLFLLCLPFNADTALPIYSYAEFYCRGKFTLLLTGLPPELLLGIAGLFVYSWFI